jgi:hypothetical protein
MKSFFQKSNIINDKLIDLKYNIKPKLNSINYSSPYSLINELNKYGFQFTNPRISFHPPDMGNNSCTIGYSQQIKYWIYIKINEEIYFSTSNI